MSQITLIRSEVRIQVTLYLNNILAKEGRAIYEKREKHKKLHKLSQAYECIIMYFF